MSAFFRRFTANSPSTPLRAVEPNKSAIRANKEKLQSSGIAGKKPVSTPQCPAKSLAKRSPIATPLKCTGKPIASPTAKPTPKQRQPFASRKCPTSRRSATPDFSGISPISVSVPKKRPTNIAQPWPKTRQPKSVRTNFQLMITAPSGYPIVKSTMTLSIPVPRERSASRNGAANAHLDETISMFTILDAIGCGRLTEFFKRAEISVAELLKMPLQDIAAVDGITALDARGLWNELRRL